MLISVAILKGFQKEISDKVVGFGSHIQISHFDSNNSYEPTAINVDNEDLQKVRSLEGIHQINSFGLKAGIIKTEDQIHGAVLKGVCQDYDWSFFKERLIEGEIPVFVDSSASDEILLSKRIADLLNFKAGSDIRMYFIINDQVRGRKFKVTGVYETGLTEFDEMYILGDIRHIQKLNNWGTGEVSGYEIRISDFQNLDRISESIYSVIGYDLNTQTIRQIYPQIFDWIEIQDLNVIIILVLLTLVSGITIISTLLILILEHTRDIGILKAMGATVNSIRKIFLITSLHITLYGVVWGNIIALGLVFIQKKYEIIPLPAESYFISHVPVAINIWQVLLINFATIIICLLMMLIPSLVVKYISPVKAIRFE